MNDNVHRNSSAVWAVSCGFEDVQIGREDKSDTSGSDKRNRCWEWLLKNEEAETLISASFVILP